MFHLDDIYNPSEISDNHTQIGCIHIILQRCIAKIPHPRARYGLYVPMELIRLANSNQIGKVRSTIT
jgi:hypothetical protein